MKSGQIDYTGLTHRYIGSAYDVVKEVHDHLDEILALHNNMELARGYDGYEGSYATLVFKRSEFTPTTPTDGTYLGDIDAEEPPTGWHIEPLSPAENLPVWVTKRVYHKTDDGWVGTDWSIPVLFTVTSKTPVQGEDYFLKDGSFKSFIYHNNSVKPDAPTGGTFDGTVEEFPEHWTDNPVNTEDYEITWVSTQVYSHDGHKWTGSGWGEPTRFIEIKIPVDGETPVHGVDYFDGNFYSFIYRNSEDIPTGSELPIGGEFDGKNEVPPTGWTDDPVLPSGNDKTWVCKGIYINDADGWATPEWSAPSIFYRKGDKPVAGVDYTTKDGDFVSFIFQNKPSQPTAPTGGTYDGSNETFPDDWTDDISVRVGLDKTWMSKTTYKHDPDNGIYTKTGWSTPIIFNEKGDKGDKPVYLEDYVTKNGNYVSFVYAITNSRDEVPPNPEGGNYRTDGVETLPTPSGIWLDDPISPVSVEVVWLSTTTYIHDELTDTWTNTGWSEPAPFYQKGDSPIEGEDYYTKDGSFVSFVYHNSEARPDKPEGGTLINGNETPPTDWTDDAEERIGVEKTWVSNTIYDHNQFTNEWSNRGWSEPVVFAEKGEQSPVVTQLTIYQRSATHLGSAPQGGSYDFSTRTLTPPFGWFITPPDGENPLYTSVGIAESDSGLTGIDSDIPWGTPVAGFRENTLKVRELETTLRITENTVEDLSQEVFNTVSDYSAFRHEYERRILEGETLTDAVVYRDPDSGLIINKAFSYTDQSYTEAGIRIDGVQGEVRINAEKLTATDNRIADAESEINVLAGEIELRATYTEVNQLVDGAISALEPAYSWQFNTSSDGWSGGTWNASGTITTVVDLPVTITGLTFDADENPMLRVSVKKGTTWQGSISWNGGSQNVPISEPTQGDNFELVNLELLPVDGWTGEITELSILFGDVEVDSIVVGKRDSADQALEDITVRVTEAEVEINALEGQIALKLDTQTWEDNKYTDSDVQVVLDAWDTSIGLTTTLTELDEANTVTKANNADLWISSADANIRAEVVAYNAEPDGINDQLEDIGAQLNSVSIELDGVENKITTQATSISGLQGDIVAGAEADFNFEYQMFLRENDRAEEGIKLAYAEENIQAVTTDQEALAQRTLDLEAITEDAVADIQEVSVAFTNSEQSTALQFSNLRVEMDQGDSEAVAEANEYTRASIGYCVDNDGNATSEEDAVACVTAGNSWIKAPLAEAVRNVQIQNAAGNTIGLTEQMSVIETDTGDLKARAALEINADGETVGGLYLEGSDAHSSFKIKADDFAVVSPENDTERLYLDTNDGTLVLVGRMVLSDGKVVNSTADIEAEDGQDGDTIYTEYEYSVNGTSNWHSILGDADYYRRDRTVTNGVNGSWSSAALIRKDGINPVATKVGDTVTITDGDGNVVNISDGDNAPIPTVTVDTNGDAVVNDGSGNTVTIENGEGATVTKDGNDITITDGYGNSTSIVKGVDYFDGNTGDYISYVYANKATTAPAITGGTFDGTNEVIPSGWDDTPTYESGKTTWVRNRRYANNGTSWVGSSWSTAKAYIVEDSIKGEDGKDATDGKDGARGAGFYTLTLRNGVFPSDAVAEQDMVDHLGFPPTGYDVLTYRNAAGTVTSTKQYVSASWTTPTALIHGSLVATDSITGDKIIAGTTLRSPSIEMIGTQYMQLSAANGFGANNEFIEWYGLRYLVDGEVDYSQITKANAITYKTVDGSAYFGGTIFSGLFKNSMTNTQSRRFVPNEVAVELGPFGTTGKPKQVLISWSFVMGLVTEGLCTPPYTQPRLSWRLERSLDDGSSWQFLISGEFNGTTEFVQDTGIITPASAESENITESTMACSVTENATGSTTFTDISTVTVDFMYRVVIVESETYYPSGDQKFSIICTEE